MAPMDVCPTEDAVKAFLEHLVDPLLPAKSSIRDKPSPSRQELVAKQVHSVVLLYNYYHRKQHPELEYLPFNEFCKLAVVLRPSLLAYMQFMQKLNEAELIDVEKQLSLPEKMIMDACNVCKFLDASKSTPNIDGWPISKVAVLLTDSKKENCFLLFGSITEGVWSVVEKDLDISSQSSEVASGTNHTFKKGRVIKKPTKDEVNAVDAQFLQVGYSAVKEAIGIDKADITHAESYTVYSQRKEKAASRFYIMQCTEFNQEAQVPLKVVIESLQGPLIKKSSNGWMLTTVVDYFHVLPYSEIISEWMSREAFSKSLQDSKVIEKNIKVDSPRVTESYVSEDTSIGLDSKPSSYNIPSLKQKENNKDTPKLYGYIKEPCDMDVDKSPVLPSHKEKCNLIGNTIRFGEDQEKDKPFVHYKSNGCTSTVKLDICASTSSDLSAKDACAYQKEASHCRQLSSFRPLSIIYDKPLKVDSTQMKSGINDHPSRSRICGLGPNTSSEKEKDAVDDRSLVANHSKTDLEKLKILLDSKGKILSQTALTALIGKRNELALQQRKIEDEIAMCDQKIRRMLTDGEDDIALKIESIIEGCNNIWARDEERMSKHQSSLSPSIKRKKIGEAAFITPSPCQELDGICHENNWVLPTYRVSQKDGGLLAKVSVKGAEFQFSCDGNVCSNPREARDSAAARVLANFKSMGEPAN